MKHRFRIPFILSFMIIVSGIIMTILDKTDVGSYSTKGGGIHQFTLTGPGVIILGIIVLVILLFYKKELK